MTDDRDVSTAKLRDRLYASYVSSGQAHDIAPDAPDENRHPKLFPPGNVARFVLGRIPADRNTRIVDLGCGHGAVLYHLQRAGYRNLIGVDTSPEQIAVARRAGLSQTVQGDIESFAREMRTGSVGVVLLIDVLEHFSGSENLAVLDEVFRVLAPEGLCIAHVPNAEGIFGMRIRYGDLTHESAFTWRSASQLFAVAGFSRVRCYEDKPSVAGVKGLARRIVWETGAFYYRTLLAAETGSTRGLFTQNMFITAVR